MKLQVLTLDRYSNENAVNFIRQRILLMAATGKFPPAEITQAMRG